MVWKRKLIMISIWQSSISFIRKKSQQARNRRELSQPDIGICEKPTANIVLTSERLNAFSLKPGEKNRNIFSYHFYSDYTGDSSHCCQVKKKEKERYWDCKEVKTDFYYRSHDHLCRKCDEIYQKELLSDFNKIVGYRANNTI